MKRSFIIFCFLALLTACDNNTPLMKQVLSGDKEEVAKLIDQGSDVNATNSYGWTALTHAARLGNIELAALLVEHGADVNHVDSAGWTPVMRAARKGHTDVIKLLVEHGAAINEVDKTGRSALHWATFHGQFETVTYLLNHGADTSLKTQEGWTARMIALQENEGEILALLDKADGIAAPSASKENETANAQQEQP